MTFSPDQLERYSRHFVLKEIGVSGQKQLAASRVLVIGAGGLGSPSLYYLAAAGVGTIGVADFDKVDLSNLQRQIIHRTASVGTEKVLSARASMLALNPDVNVNTHSLWLTAENIEEVIAPYDFVIEATDSFESKLLVNDACVLNRKPFVHGGMVRFEGQVLTWVPGEGGPCFRCVAGSAPEQGSVTCSQVGVLGAALGILGSIQATEAIKYLLGKGELLTGRMLFVDGLSMSFDEVRITDRNPGCRVCGEHADISDLKANAAEYAPKECAL